MLNISEIGNYSVPCKILMLIDGSFVHFSPLQQISLSELNKG